MEKKSLEDIGMLLSTTEFSHLSCLSSFLWIKVFLPSVSLQVVDASLAQRHSLNKILLLNRMFFRILTSEMPHELASLQKCWTKAQVFRYFFVTISNAKQYFCVPQVRGQTNPHGLLWPKGIRRVKNIEHIFII